MMISQSAIQSFSCRLAFCLLLAITMAGEAPAQTPGSPPPHPKDLQVVLLGTGTPRPNPDQQGPSLAIIAGGKAYLVDAGVGIVRQANAAFLRGVSPLRPAALDVVFLTHLHSDHTLGLPDLILTPWIFEREKPLQLYGPSGTKEWPTTSWKLTPKTFRCGPPDWRVEHDGLQSASSRNRAGRRLSG